MEETNGSVNSVFMPAATTNPDEIPLPNIEEAEQVVVGNVDSSSLETIDIEPTLMQETIRSIAAHEIPDFEVPSYMLDMSELDGKLTESSLKALDSMLPGGDTAVYIKVRESCFLVGRGDGAVLYQILDVFVAKVYGPDCRLYKNTGAGFIELKPTDIAGIRLDI